MLGRHCGLAGETEFDRLAQNHLGDPFVAAGTAMGQAVIEGHRFVKDEDNGVRPRGENGCNALQFSAYHQVLKGPSHCFERPASAARYGLEDLVGCLGIAGGARHHHCKRSRDQNVARTGDNHRSLLHGLTVLTHRSPIFNQ